MSTSNPIRHHRVLLWLLAALAVMIVGCGLGGDDDGEADVLVLEIDAVVTEGGKSAAAAVDDPERLRGRAQIRCFSDGLPAGCEDICDGECAAAGELVGDAMLEVSVETIDPLHVILSGELSFSLGASGSRYRLDVALLEQGDGIAGVYAGDLVMNSGLEAMIEPLTLGEPLPDPPHSLDWVQICMSSDFLDIEEACVDTNQGVSGFYDGETNDLLLSYIRHDVDVDGTEADNVVVEFSGGLLPVPVYAGCAEIEGITVGGGAPIEVTVEMVPTGREPGDPGERLTGTIFVGLFHDDGSLDASEVGRFATARLAVPPPPGP